MNYPALSTPEAVVRTVLMKAGAKAGCALALAAAAPVQAQLPAAALPAALPAPVLAQALALVGEAAAALAPPGARVQVLPGTLDGRLVLAACARVDPYLPGGVPAWGRTRVGLRCAEGPTRWNVSLPVTVQVWAAAAVPATALPAGARLASSQLQTAEVDWAATPAPPLADPQALAGRTLARAVVPGQPLHAADLQPRQWFAAGETVRVQAGGSGYAVSAEGQAVGAGLEGVPARVRLESGRILVGRPVGERLMEVGP